MSRSGCSRTCQAIAGTPPMVVIFSRWMISSASAVSHLYMVTILSAFMMAGTRFENAPVAWKNGIASSGIRGGSTFGSRTGTGRPWRRKCRDWQAMPLNTFETMPRCVASAPLGFPVVPRGVHDRRVVVRADFRVGHRDVRQVLPPIGRADQLVERDDARVGFVVDRAGDQHVLELRQLGHVLADALELFRVDDGDLRAGIGQAVLQLLPCPPRVHRRCDGADRQRREEPDWPLRIVAHDEATRSPCLHAEIVAEPCRQMRHSLVVRSERHALVLIDQEFPRRPS